MPLTDDELAALVEGRCGDPFALLGPHALGDGRWLVRVWDPRAEAVEATVGDESLALPRVHEAGVFEAELSAGERPAYGLHVRYPGYETVLEADSYAFGELLDDWDLARFAEGRHHHLWRVLGARPLEVGGVRGVRFAVWAPNARAVSVAGDWNAFDERAAPMRRRHPQGVWELFVPGLGEGLRYKYAVLGSDDHRRIKADPVALACEVPPATASVIAPGATDETFAWDDDDWIAARAAAAETWRRRPMAIYEVHLGSWRRDEHGDALGYRAIAEPLIAHCLACGFTHVEFLPLTAHPYEGSWGYQVSGFYAPDARHGSADDLRFLVDELHRAGIGVIMDVVPGHFPRDDFALARFDGSPCYEYGDPREGEHGEWGTLVFNYRRPEVRNFLLASFLSWIERFHVDALRVDAVSAMLYRDYDREEGAWIPNEEGGNANREAVSFLQEFNAVIHDRFPGVLTIAEESTDWKGTTAPTEWQGLGFDLKWNMGWMHDSLRYLSLDPIHRAAHHEVITFHQWYAYDERWVLPLSHDEVVHGKGSLVDKLPGTWEHRRAQLRLLLAWQVAIPGRPLLFMGGEIAQGREWDWKGSVAWDEGLQPERAAVCTFLARALECYRTEPALHAADDQRDGYAWVEDSNRDESVLAFLRRAPDARPVLVACNFTPVPRKEYPLGVPCAGRWEVLLDSDREEFAGGGYTVRPHYDAVAEPRDPWPATVRVDLPPLAAVFLVPEE